MKGSYAVLVVLACACGPAVSPAGDSGGADGTGGGESTAVSATSPSDSGVTASSVASSDPSTSTSSDDDVDDGDDDSAPKWDHPYPDSPPPLICPLDFPANAEVMGSSPMGAFEATHAWFGTGGGGKCPYGYDVRLLPSSPDALGDLDDALQPGLHVFVMLGGPEGPATGRFPAQLRHHGDRDYAYAEGVAVIDAVGEDGVSLHGTVVTDDPAWVLAAEFDATWCELLDHGACGAITPPP